MEIDLLIKAFPLMNKSMERVKTCLLPPWGTNFSTKD
jgi:hypothetical protein